MGNLHSFCLDKLKTKKRSGALHRLQYNTNIKNLKKNENWNLPKNKKFSYKTLKATACAGKIVTTGFFG